MGRKQDTYRFGLFAEWIAAWGLRLRGYKILARRYKSKVGEIDLVARKDNVLVFVEVKARRRIEAALECLTPAMQRRIVRAATSFLAQNRALAECEMRFDLIALAPPFYWRHLDNAFRPAT